jgi:hypothetical protein
MLWSLNESGQTVAMYLSATKIYNPAYYYPPPAKIGYSRK